MHVFKSMNSVEVCLLDTAVFPAWYITVIHTLLSVKGRMTEFRESLWRGCDTWPG